MGWRKVVGHRGLLLALALAGLAAGCDADDDGGDGDGVVFVADLQVDWTINGAQGPALCDVFDIDHWVLAVRGPDSFDVVIDCRGDVWTSGEDLFGIAEGDYTITVRAEDASGHTRAALATDIDLFDQGFVEHLTLDFLPADFR